MKHLLHEVDEVNFYLKISFQVAVDKSKVAERLFSIVREPLPWYLKCKGHDPGVGVI